MAKVVIAGNAVVINSTIKFEDIKKVAKARPTALTLMGGEDGKEPIFAIGACASANGVINANGAFFGSATRDDAKLATITMVVENEGDIKEFVAEELGAALINLSKLEEKLPAVIEEINAEKASVLESITIAQ